MRLSAYWLIPLFSESETAIDYSQFLTNTIFSVSPQSSEAQTDVLSAYDSYVSRSVLSIHSSVSGVFEGFMVVFGVGVGVRVGAFHSICRLRRRHVASRSRNISPFSLNTASG